MCRAKRKRDGDRQREREKKIRCADHDGSWRDRFPQGVATDRSGCESPCVTVAVISANGEQRITDLPSSYVVKRA